MIHGKVAAVDRHDPDKQPLEIDMVRHAVGRMLADQGDWQAALAMGLPLLCGEMGGTLGDAVAIVSDLGRAASMLPLAEAVTVNLFAPGLVPSDKRIAIAFGADNLQVAGSGDCLTGTLSMVEGADAADCLVIALPDGQLLVVATQSRGVAITPLAALGDGLCRIDLSGAMVLARRDLGERTGAMRAVMRLLLCARALGAAGRGFDAVTEYAKIRKQFGKTIGSFQAIQHRLADSRIALASCRLLLDDAAAAFDNHAQHWRAVADASLVFSSPVLRQVALQTQHVFGAIGFAEEHDAPALFRRVHVDAVRLGGELEAGQGLGELLLGGSNISLADLLADPQDPALPFREQLRAWLKENWTAGDRATAKARAFADREWDLRFLERLGSDGWTTLNWPADAGGMAATARQQLAFTEELIAAGAPEHPMICSCRIMAPEIIAHGSASLRAKLLPDLRAGKITGCLGYSEPDSGSDLASLRTRAVLDGDHYIVNGQKIWTTDGHRASHMILAARTDDDPAKRHAGISLFIVPMVSPGITVRPMTGLHGHVFCNIFFDDVIVPAGCRLGHEGQGWAILANALANERITMGAFVSRLAALLQQVIDSLRSDPRISLDRAAAAQIGRLASRLLAGRALALDSIKQTDAGHVPVVEAAMGKVFASELAQDICETALDLLGESALLCGDMPTVPAGGMVEEILRLSIMYVVGGGSNEIQRSLIAGRGLGLGR